MIDQSWYHKTQNAPTFISAGGVVVRWEGQQVYVALVRGEKYTEYILPKGHLEAGETLEEAARREIEEEGGFSQLELITKLGIRERFNFAKTNWKVTHYFLFSTEQINVKPTDPNRYYETHWFTFDQLPPLFWPEQQELVQLSRSILRNRE
ncbi:NUDIX domain-containing protein [Spirulina subsalsa]|uniref:NUDIX domain-containing protein n=1 Tax=Spirulina subsalsa TaxID=54311 RepID=UPI00031F6336|nr:NUDIX domain-containing protein [Spirulina subsalsa]